MILIIDNESKFIKIFEKTLQQWEVRYKLCSCLDKINPNDVADIKGVILSGGPGDPNHHHNIKDNHEVLMNFNVPIMGLCLGHEIIAIAFGNITEKLPEYQEGMQKVIIDNPEDPIFEMLGREISIRQKHGIHVTRVPRGFLILAHSELCTIEAMRHRVKPIYGFQGHPEVSGKDGLQIMKNFLKICNINYAKQY